MYEQTSPQSLEQSGLRKIRKLRVISLHMRNQKLYIVLSLCSATNAVDHVVYYMFRCMQVK